MSVLTFNAFSQVEVSGVAINIGASVNVHVESDVSLASDVDWVNNGSFLIFCKRNTNVHYNLYEDARSNGDFHLLGDKNIYLSSELSMSKINNLIVDCTLLNLESNLKVKLLNFSNGVIDVSDGNLLSVDDSSEESLVYTINSTNYIKGYFKRKVKPGGSYMYPVGGSNGLCYAKIDNVESDREIVVGYIPVDSDAFILDSNKYNQVTEGSWDVLCDSEDGSSFSLCLDIENLLKDGVNRGYKLIGVDRALSNNHVYSLDTYIYYPQVQTDNGIYNFRYVLAEEISFKIVNLIVANGKGGGFFRLPEISTVEWRELTVIDSQGKLVFHTDRYMNDLTFSNLREGVYFYKLSYSSRKGEVKTINNFIEVVYEK